MSEVRVIRVDGPALVFGGNCSNLEATRALLQEARRRAIAPQNIFCTGDVIACCADPLATVEVMRRSGVNVVMGNCEESLGSNAPGSGCGFPPGSACEQLAAEWYAFAGRMLDEAARAWMRALPRRLVVEIADRRLAVIHGGVRRINRYIFASTPAAIKREEIEEAGCDGVIGGHCGLPFAEIVDGRLWHNPGSIGLPANDGTPRTWYSTLVANAGKLRIEFHALEYDYASAARKMRQAGLSARYALALQTGIWPDCLMLPEAERARHRSALAPAALDW